MAEISSLEVFEADTIFGEEPPISISLSNTANFIFNLDTSAISLSISYIHFMQMPYVFAAHIYNTQKQTHTCTHLFLHGIHWSCGHSTRKWLGCPGHLKQKMEFESLFSLSLSLCSLSLSRSMSRWHSLCLSTNEVKVRSDFILSHSSHTLFTQWTFLILASAPTCHVRGDLERFPRRVQILVPRITLCQVKVH